MDIFTSAVCLGGFTLSYMADAQRGFWHQTSLTVGTRIGYVLTWHLPILLRHLFPVVLIVQEALQIFFAVQTPLWLWAVSIGGVIGDIDYAINPC